MPGALEVVSFSVLSPCPELAAHLFVWDTYSKGTDCCRRTIALLLHMWSVPDSGTNTDTGNSDSV
jgi:hypothetical protein